MRTTVTLDPDVVVAVRRAMSERDVSFKTAINEAIRAGLLPTASEPARTPTFPMGLQASVSLDKALQLSGQLEDEETRRKLAARK